MQQLAGWVYPSPHPALFLGIPLSSTLAFALSVVLFVSAFVFLGLIESTLNGIYA